MPRHVFITLLVAGTFCFGCSTKKSTTLFQPETARNKILAALPGGWSIIPQSSTEQEDTKAYFDDARTDAFILLGPKFNCLVWTDKRGVTHRDYLAKECLYIWIIPSDFTPNFPHWWTDPPVLPKLIYSSRESKVYGLVYQHFTDTNRFQTILDKECGGEIYTQAGDISWHNWRKDILESIKK